MTSRTLGTQIVVVDNGFIYVGTVTLDGGFCLIANARNIREWGTSKGLGQLRGGPTEKTKLDVAGEVMVPMARVVHFIRCTKDW